jgi:hypothetical protein
MAKMKFGKWEYSDEEFNRQFEEASMRGKEAAVTEPRANNVTYAPGSELITLDVTVRFPKDFIEELVDATPEQIAAVRVDASGSSLRWDDLNLDLGVAELLKGVYGTQKWMAKLGRKGGRATSGAKAAAARENGKKGGRPPKRAA